MKYFIAHLLFFFSFGSGTAQQIKIENPVRFLALGDSYTIGQSVNVADRWPNQLAGELTNRGFTVDEVKIIAQTGWRTDNLKNAVEQQKPLTGFNLVALLIGVNNQYQGGSTSTYYNEFSDLLKTALQLASGKPEHVFVLSIPDYAYTPYGRGNSVISTQIDQFNSINKIITDSYRIKYIDITPISRRGLQQPELVATDGLHPSGIMYGLWVQEILKSMEKELAVEDTPVSNNEISFSVNQRQVTVQAQKHSGSFFVYSYTGQLVHKGRLSANAVTNVNMGTQAAGMYVLVFEKDGKPGYRAKFILP